ncbi:hypothetical protein [Streptomyces sp. CC208A]|uniref:hypothetical protein n=1 Tax=Streptomyces sp. CC208A TaxID=3044573 RepID=UPI0024A8D3ED|nr:hypothetical protein [Streptomyces sp. CC208A]
MNAADENGTDAEIYRKTGHPDRLHIVSRADAPEELLDLLDAVGLERLREETDGPVYTWHETPEGLSQEAQRQLATRAILPLLVAGYNVNIDPDEFDVTAWAQAMQAHRASQSRTAGPSQPPPPPAVGPTRPRR